MSNKKESKAIQAKKEVVAEIKEKVKKAKSLLFIDYKGLNVEQDTQMRREFRKNNVEYKVLKNTLAKKALNELGYKEFDVALNGATAFAFGYGDEVTPAKLAVANIEKFKLTRVKCALVDGKYIDEKGVEALSKLPSKEVLIAQALSMFNAPISGLVNVLSGTIRSLCYVLNARVAKG